MFEEKSKKREIVQTKFDVLDHQCSKILLRPGPPGFLATVLLPTYCLLHCLPADLSLHGDPSLSRESPEHLTLFAYVFGGCFASALETGRPTRCGRTPWNSARFRGR